MAIYNERVFGLIHVMIWMDLEDIMLKKRHSLYRTSSKSGKFGETIEQLLSGFKMQTNGELLHDMCRDFCRGRKKIVLGTDSGNYCADNGNYYTTCHYLMLQIVH